MRSVMTLFVLFASLMLVIPTAAAAVINDGGKETEIPAVTVSDNTESESEALQKAGPGQEKEQTALCTALDANSIVRLFINPITRAFNLRLVF